MCGVAQDRLDDVCGRSAAASRRKPSKGGQPTDDRQLLLARMSYDLSRVETWTDDDINNALSVLIRDDAVLDMVVRDLLADPQLVHDLANTDLGDEVAGRNLADSDLLADRLTWTGLPHYVATSSAAAGLMISLDDLSDNRLARDIVSNRLAPSIVNNRLAADFASLYAEDFDKSFAVGIVQSDLEMARFATSALARSLAKRLAMRLRLCLRARSCKPSWRR